MDDRALYVMAGLAEGLNNATDDYQKAAQNMTNIQSARFRLQKEQESWQTESKIKELQLKKLENELDPGVVSLQRDKLKNEASLRKAQFNLYAAKSREAEVQAERAIEGAAREKDLWESIVQGAVLDPRLSLDAQGVKYNANKASSSREDMTTKDVMASLNALNKNRMPGDPKDPLQEQLESILRDRLNEYAPAKGLSKKDDEEPQEEGKGKNKLPKWLPKDKADKYNAAIDAGYTEAEIKKYLGVS